MLLVDHIESPLGPIVLLARDSRLVALDFTDGDGVRLLGGRLGSLRQTAPGGTHTERASDPFGLSSRVRAYFGGDVRVFDDVEIEAVGTPFQRLVWGVLRHIPPGATITYTELARAAGRPRAIRAAGAANACNRLAIAVPCHRVVGSDGSLTGYGGGLWRKRWLLRHEGALVGSSDSSHVSAPV